MKTLYYQYSSEEMDYLLKHKLQTAISTIDLTIYTKEDIRKAIQLAILKGMKDSTQQQHLMTPETVALLVKYLVEKLTANKETFRLFDQVCGTGNILLIYVETI